MYTKELTSALEDLNWVPATNIRPHHVVNWMTKGFIDNLKFYIAYPIMFTRAGYLTVKYPQEFTAINQDTYGPAGIPQDPQQEQEESFLQDLRNLPSDSVVQLDLAPDGICKSCPTGKHCRATNFRSLGKRWDIVVEEKSRLRQIRRRLFKKGFQQEVDFKIIQTNTEFLDYQGEDLWTNLHPPQPITAQYDAMLVRMGTLREIVDNKF